MTSRFISMACTRSLIVAVVISIVVPGVADGQAFENPEDDSIEVVYVNHNLMMVPEPAAMGPSGELAAVPALAYFSENHFEVVSMARSLGRDNSRGYYIFYKQNPQQFHYVLERVSKELYLGKCRYGYGCIEDQAYDQLRSLYKKGYEFIDTVAIDSNPLSNSADLLLVFKHSDNKPVDASGVFEKNHRLNARRLLRLRADYKYRSDAQQAIAEGLDRLMDTPPSLGAFNGIAEYGHGLIVTYTSNNMLAASDSTVLAEQGLEYRGFRLQPLLIPDVYGQSAEDIADLIEEVQALGHVFLKATRIDRRLIENEQYDQVVLVFAVPTTKDIEEVFYAGRSKNYR